MAVAAEYRLMHSEFLAKDKLDRDKAIWWYVRKGETCQNCGTREAEWDPERGGHRQAYGTEIKVCRGCEVKEAAQESEDAKVGRGVYVRMRKNDAYR